MDRNREARRAPPMAASIGLSRRRHRSNSLRDSPDDDVAVELPEMARLRDRGSLKKDRERERDRAMSRSKRRRGGDGDESSEESVNDDEDEDDDDGGVVGVRMLPPNHQHQHHHNPPSSSSSIQNHHRKSYPAPPAKVFRPTWKPADEMIGVSVPRKARSASTKRSHECWVSGAGDQIHGQASTSPARTGLAVAAQAPLSPTSSNASVRKRIKSNGAKHRPPKSSSKSSSSAQDEIEIEIAEVLYGMMRQPLIPSKQENMVDSMKLDNKLSADAKSRVSSPVSNSPSTAPSQPIQNSGSSVTHISAIAPKRKRPRPVKYEDENPTNFAVRSSPISKAETDQPGNSDAPTSTPIEAAGSAAENGGGVEAVPESFKLESHPSEGSKVLSEESESGDVVVRKEEAQTVTKAKAVSTACGEIETPRDEKFQIDLMAPPPSRSSPEEGEGEIEFVAVDPKPMVSDVDMEQKNGGDVHHGGGGMKMESGAPLEKKAKLLLAEEEIVVNSSKNKDRVAELQLELEKPERDCAFPPANNKPPVIHKHHQPAASDKTQNQASSVSMPMNVAGWPGALPPMGYMAPLQGVVSMDGSNVPSVAAASAAGMQPPHLVFTQPRPKRCATHCYIARNICYHQQFTRINPFWPAAAGSASLYGPKACNLNVLPPSADLHTNIPGRSVNSPQDKGQGVTVFPASKDKPSQASLNMVDASQRKQMYALPPGAPSNILHGPAFIFPLSQQQAAAASVRSGSVKSPVAAGHNSASSGASVSATAAASARAAGAATAMSFNYPNMPGNETQYLAILQNNAYPFPIPAHVGAPAYRGTHGQAMPFFSGSFYSSQMLHPSQIQQQQLPAQSQQSQQGHQAQQSQQGHQAQQVHQSQQQSHQNTSMSGGSSSSQKQLHSSHQRPHGNGSGNNLQGFPASKNQPTQQLQSQQRQHQQQQNLVSLQARQIEGEMGGEDRSKAGVESMQSSAFAMSFASINGATANGIDISSFTQNHAILQSLPEATRHGYQIMAAAAAAQAAQQKKSYRFSEEGKGGSADASTADEERKVVGGKPAAPVGQSIAFSRPDLTDTSSTVPSNTVIDGSVRTLNLGSTPTWATGSVMPAAMNTVNASPSQQQLQWQQQQQQMMQLQKQHHFAAAAAAVARSKTPTSNGNAYSDHLPSSPSMASKFPTLSAFPQSLVQSSSSPAQSPQWKNSGRTTTSQAPSQSLASSTSSSLKNLSQQQGRSQQNHTQISFAANSKPSNSSQVQQIPNNNQSSSPPVMVGSPTSSMSKGAGGSPRATTSASTGNKVGQASTLSSHQSKNSPSQPSRKSSPVGGRNVPSILGNPHNTSSSSGSKHQLSQQQQHQQAQLLFSNYMQAQATHSPSPGSTSSGASGYYLQRRQQQQGTSSSGMLSLCPPVSHATASTTDPAKAVAAAAASMKGGGLPSQGILHAAQFAAAQSSGNAHQLLPGGFTYGVHTVSSAVQGKSAEQKQPAEEEQTRNDFALNRGSGGGYKS